MFRAFAQTSPERDELNKLQRHNQQLVAAALHEPVLVIAGGGFAEHCKVVDGFVAGCKGVTIGAIVLALAVTLAAVGGLALRRPEGRIIAVLTLLLALALCAIFAVLFIAGNFLHYLYEY